MATRASREPMIGGRIVRALAGLACFAGIGFVPEFDLAWLGIAALAGAGGIFLLAAIISNPGCEITAPINVFLPRSRRIDCLCPLFTPIDRLESALRSGRRHNT